MLKMDLKNSSLSATFVQYEIYNPNTLDLVSLDVCKDIPITLNMPVYLDNRTETLYLSLGELGYNIFNISDSFYNDICSKYTAQNGADMILSKRKNVIYDIMLKIFLYVKRIALLLAIIAQLKKQNVIVQYKQMKQLQI